MGVLHGNAPAIRAFHDAYRDDALRAARRVRAAGVDPEDLAQEFSRKVLGPPSPRIAEFSGRGDLRVWVRIVATRLALDAARIKKNNERPEDETAFRGIAAATDAPKLAYFRRL